jgi:glutaredoxin 3
MTRVVIYTKDNCTYCVQAKNLLNKHKYTFQEKNLKDIENRSELLFLYPEAKTVPQIFIDSTHIGGYTDLVSYIEQNS